MESSISGLVVEYIVAIDVTRVRFPDGARAVGVLLLDWSVRESNFRRYFTLPAAARVSTVLEQDHF